MNPDKIRNVLNILFMILALAAIITYFVVGKEDFKMFIYVCGAAIFVKLMEFFIRFTNRSGEEVMTKEEIIKPENLVYKKPTLMNDNAMHYCPGCSHGVVHKLIAEVIEEMGMDCLLYTSPSPRDAHESRMPSSA